MNQKYAEIDCTIVWETQRALLIDDGDNECWVPKSMCDLANASGKVEIGSTITLPISYGIAKSKGLV